MTLHWDPWTRATCESGLRKSCELAPDVNQRRPSTPRASYLVVHGSEHVQ